VGDAGEMVNPENVDEIAETMYRLVARRGQREARRAAGLERARAFSWQRAAAETAQVYRRVLGDRITDYQG
jgi:glycosyltransferase involved in cell wall biosynthesis